MGRRGSTPNPPPHMCHGLKHALMNVDDDAAPGHHEERDVLGPGRGVRYREQALPRAVF